MLLREHCEAKVGGRSEAPTDEGSIVMRAPSAPPPVSFSDVAAMPIATLPLSSGQADTAVDKQIEWHKLALAQNQFEHERERDRKQLELDLQKLGIEHVKVNRDSQKSSRDAVIKFAEVGIRSLLILNGGAALSLLAFVGHGSSAPGSKFVPADWAAVFACFAIGAAFAVITAGLSYLAQVISFDLPRRAPEFVRRWAPTATRANVFGWFRNAAIGASVIGIGAFIVGLLAAYCAMSSAASHSRSAVRAEAGSQFATPWQAEHEGFWRDRPGAINRP